MSVLFIRIDRSENLKYFLSEGIDPCFTEALAGIESAENPLPYLDILLGKMTCLNQTIDRVIKYNLYRLHYNKNSYCAE